MRSRQPSGRAAGTPRDENSSTSRGVPARTQNTELVRELSKQVIGALIIVFLVATLTPAPGNAQGIPPDPGLSGPFPVDQFNFTLQSLGATVFYPGAGGVVAAGGPFPGLVLGHGFAHARAQHANNGVFLASHGYIVVTVDFPNPLSPDFDAWAAQISAALDWLEAENANPTSASTAKSTRTVSACWVIRPAAWRPGWPPGRTVASRPSCRWTRCRARALTRTPWARA